MVLDEQDLERVLVLKRIPLFRYLSLDTLLAVARAVQSRQYLPGDIVVSGREQPDQCYILEAGTVSLSRGATAERLAAPACLNELVLIGEVAPTGPIVALEPCRVLLLHAVVLQDLSRDHPEILLELCRSLARRVRAAEAAEPGRIAIRTAEALST
jgi:CRP-like cAMP-binding protein